MRSAAETSPVKHCMLQRHEQADATARGIDRPGKGDDEEHDIGVDHRERDAGCDHEAGRRKQKLAMVESDSEDADGKRKKGGAEQRRRRNDTDLERRKTEPRQVNRQNQRDKAIAEVAK